MKNKYPIYPVITALITFLFIAAGGWQAAVARENLKTISVLPFKINASENLTHVQEGIVQMLYSRLSWQDKVVVTPPGLVKTYLPELKNASKKGGLNELAQLTRSDFILTGTLTRLGGSFSIDVQVYDIENKRYMAFFEQSQKPDALIGKVSRIAATVNKKIFDRPTATWEKMEEEKQAYIKEMKRKNPEYMMKSPQWQDTDASPGWKIWKYLF